MTKSNGIAVRKTVCALLALVVLLGGVGFGCANDRNGEKETMKAGEAGSQSELTGHPQIKFTVQVDGEEPFDFIMELYPEYAPITCENFASLVKSGFYDGLTFHRIVDGFMVQGGDPNGNGSGGTTPIKGEFAANGVNNPLSHTRGVVSMARQYGRNNSGSCQFFICYSDRYTGSLDGQYAAFGKVIEGMENLDGLQNLERVMGGDNALSKPVKNVVIQSAVFCDEA